MDRFEFTFEEYRDRFQGPYLAGMMLGSKWGTTFGPQAVQINYTFVDANEFSWESEEMAAVRSAMNKWEAVAQIKFVPTAPQIADLIFTLWLART